MIMLNKNKQSKTTRIQTEMFLKPVQAFGSTRYVKSMKTFLNRYMLIFILPIIYFQNM